MSATLAAAAPVVELSQVNGSTWAGTLNSPDGSLVDSSIALTRSGLLSWRVELSIETKEGAKLSATWPLWALTEAGAKRRAERFAGKARGWVGGKR